MKSWESLQLKAIQSEMTYRFRIRARADVTPQMRAVWTPRWPMGSAAQTLELTGVQPDPKDVLRYQLLDVVRIAA
jgi:head-tail adaptor